MTKVFGVFLGHSDKSRHPYPSPVYRLVPFPLQIYISELLSTLFYTNIELLLRGFWRLWLAQRLSTSVTGLGMSQRNLLSRTMSYLGSLYTFRSPAGFVQNFWLSFILHECSQMSAQACCWISSDVRYTDEPQYFHQFATGWLSFL